MTAEYSHRVPRGFATAGLSHNVGAGVELMADEELIRPPDSGVFRLCCDSTRIRELTGFKPEYFLRDGLKETIEWFTSSGNMNRYKAGIYNV